MDRLTQFVDRLEREFSAKTERKARADICDELADLLWNAHEQIACESRQLIGLRDQKFVSTAIDVILLFGGIVRVRPSPERVRSVFGKALFTDIKWEDTKMAPSNQLMQYLLRFIEVPEEKATYVCQMVTIRLLDYVLETLMMQEKRDTLTHLFDTLPWKPMLTALVACLSRNERPNGSEKVSDQCKFFISKGFMRPEGVSTFLYRTLKPDVDSAKMERLIQTTSLLITFPPSSVSMKKFLEASIPHWFPIIFDAERLSTHKRVIYRAMGYILNRKFDLCEHMLRPSIMPLYAVSYARLSHKSGELERSIKVVWDLVQYSEPFPEVYKFLEPIIECLFAVLNFTRQRQLNEQEEVVENILQRLNALYSEELRKEVLEIITKYKVFPVLALGTFLELDETKHLCATRPDMWETPRLDAKGLALSLKPVKVHIAWLFESLLPQVATMPHLRRVILAMSSEYSAEIWSDSKIREQFMTVFDENPALALDLIDSGCLESGQFTNDFSFVLAALMRLTLSLDEEVVQRSTHLYNRLCILGPNSPTLSAATEPPNSPKSNNELVSCIEDLSSSEPALRAHALHQLRLELFKPDETAAKKKLDLSSRYVHLTDLVLKLMGDEDEFVRMHAVKTLDALLCSDINELIPIIVQKFVSAELKDSVKQGMARVLNLKLPEFEDEILEVLAKSKLSPDTLTQLCKQ